MQPSHQNLQHWNRIARALFFLRCKPSDLGICTGLPIHSQPNLCFFSKENNQVLDNIRQVQCFHHYTYTLELKFQQKNLIDVTQLITHIKFVKNNISWIPVKYTLGKWWRVLRVTKDQTEELQLLIEFF